MDGSMGSKGMHKGCKQQQQQQQQQQMQQQQQQQQQEQWSAEQQQQIMSAMMGQENLAALQVGLAMMSQDGGGWAEPNGNDNWQAGGKGMHKAARFNPY